MVVGSTHHGAQESPEVATATPKLHACVPADIKMFRPGDSLARSMTSSKAARLLTPSSPSARRALATLAHSSG
jgi:hypothetical protein